MVVRHGGVYYDGEASIPYLYGEVDGSPRTMGTLPDASTDPAVKTGDICWVTNGLFGKPALCVYDGTNWLAINGADYTGDIVIKPFSVFVVDAAAAVDRWIWVGRGGWDLLSVNCVFTAASTSGRVQIAKAADGTALSGATNMLVAGMSLFGAANTNVQGVPLAIHTTVADGWNVGLKFSGTLTNLANLTVMCYWDKPAAGFNVEYPVANASVRTAFS